MNTEMFADMVLCQLLAALLRERRAARRAKGKPSR
jgi:hypothetical protein